MEDEALSGGPVIFLSAGEESGDQHASRVARALRERWPKAVLLGLGGPRMEAEGVELVAGIDELAVMGFAEVLAHLPFFWRLERRVDAILDERGVDLVIPVDYPGFNLRLARTAREKGLPVLYYIAPQVWAWKEQRAARLARDADRLAVILPFEVEIFRREGANVHFVGHPLLDRHSSVPSREEFCASVGLDPERPILALFPGSRRQELRRHVRIFTETWHRLQRERTDLQVCIARAPSVPPEWMRPEWPRWVGRAAPPEVDSYPITMDGRALLRHARAALVKSGTSTLEAALEGVPFVTAYRTSPLTHFLARRMVKVEHIALANLVAGGEVVPEAVQGDANPDELTRLLLPLLDDSARREEMIRGLKRVRALLGEPGAVRKVVDLAAELVDRRRVRT